jgi:hypothetical protein
MNPLRRRKRRMKRISLPIRMVGTHIRARPGGYLCGLQFSGSVSPASLETSVSDPGKTQGD